MVNEINNCSLRIIKTVRDIVFLYALFVGLKGIWLLIDVGTVTSQVFLWCSVSILIMVSVYKFSKEIKENKVGGTRTLSWFLGNGVPVSFCALTFGIMEKNLEFIILFSFLAIFFMFISIWCNWFFTKMYDRLNNSDKKDD